MTNEEIEFIYTENFRKIYHFFYYKTLSREIAEDLTSQTFLALIEALKKDREIENYTAFLVGTAKNLFCGYLRKKYRGIKSVAIDLIESMGELEFLNRMNESYEEFKEKKTDEERAMKYIEKLPDKQREVITMRLIKKMSLTEIAAALGKDMNYVKTTQKRAIHRLKELVETEI